MAAHGSINTSPFVRDCSDEHRGVTHGSSINNNLRKSALKFSTRTVICYENAITIHTLTKRTRKPPRQSPVPSARYPQPPGTVTSPLLFMT